MLNTIKSVTLFRIIFYQIMDIVGSINEPCHGISIWVLLYSIYQLFTSDTIRIYDFVWN